MRLATCLAMAALLCRMGLAADDADHAKLMGTWQAEGDNGDGAVWSFTAQDNSVRITQVEGGSKVADFVCGTNGTPCDVKTAGKKATVSLWYNGPKLVELETKGSDVVERRFSVLSAVDGMQLEVVPMVPSGKTEMLKFKRSTVAAAKR